MVLFNSLTHTQYNLKNSKNENILTDLHILLADMGIIQTSVFCKSNSDKKRQETTWQQKYNKYKRKNRSGYMIWNSE